MPMSMINRALVHGEELLIQVRRTSDEHTRRAELPVQSYCWDEAHVFCESELQGVEAVHQVYKGDYNGNVYQALRGLHVCVASHYKQLSTPCFNTLVEFFMPKMEPTSGPPPTTPLNTSDTVSGEERKKPRRMRRHQEDDGKGDSYAREGGGGGVAVYVINRASPLHHTYTIDYQEQAGRSNADGCVHPLLWAVIVPFFCVGVYVTAKRVTKCIQDRVFRASSSYERVPSSRDTLL